MLVVFSQIFPRHLLSDVCFCEVFQLFPMREETPEVTELVLMDGTFFALEKRGAISRQDMVYARKRRTPRNSWVSWVIQGSFNGTHSLFWGGIKQAAKSIVILKNFPKKSCIVWVGVI